MVGSISIVKLFLYLLLEIAAIESLTLREPHTSRASVFESLSAQKFSLFIVELSNCVIVELEVILKQKALQNFMSFKFFTPIEDIAVCT